jgi:hypothetical protein
VHLLTGTTTSNDPARSAGFPTCCIADFQVGRRNEYEAPAGLEIRVPHRKQPVHNSAGNLLGSAPEVTGSNCGQSLPPRLATGLLWLDEARKNSLAFIQSKLRMSGIQYPRAGGPKEDSPEVLCVEKCFFIEIG